MSTSTAVIRIRRPRSGERRVRLFSIALPVLVVFAVLSAGCALGDAGRTGTRTVDDPLTLTALDVGQPTFPFRCIQRCSVAEP